MSIAAGTTVAANGYLNLFSGTLNGGTLAARGTIDAQSGFTGGGTATLLIDGSAPQTFTGYHLTTSGDLPNVEISSSSTVTLVGILRLSTGTWTYTSGTVERPGHQPGRVRRDGHDQRQPHPRRRGAAGQWLEDGHAGTTLTVAGLLTLTTGASTAARSTRSGNVNLLGTFDGETGTIRIAGTTDQTLTGAATPTTGDVASIVIDKSGGTLHLVGTIHLLTASWTWLAGAVDPGTSLLVLDSGTTISGTHTLHDMLVKGGAHTDRRRHPDRRWQPDPDNGTIDGGTLGAAGDVTSWRPSTAVPGPSRSTAPAPRRSPARPP